MCGVRGAGALPGRRDQEVLTYDGVRMRVGPTSDEEYERAVAAGHLARTGLDSQQTEDPALPDRTGNLWEPADGRSGHDYGAHGNFDDHAAAHSPVTAPAHHPAALLGGLLGAALGAAAVARSALRRQSGCRS
ncbi:hypothetical protein [Streptomyces sp. CA2R101]|uniref:hypothetical protein n=1 Tax=Streptomyces sp. CA2R101 TaxID=3120152 RepID=UPI003008F94E